MSRNSMLSYVLTLALSVFLVSAATAIIQPLPLGIEGPESLDSDLPINAVSSGGDGFTSGGVITYDRINHTAASLKGDYSTDATGMIFGIADFVVQESDGGHFLEVPVIGRQRTSYKVRLAHVSLNPERVVGSASDVLRSSIAIRGMNYSRKQLQQGFVLKATRAQSSSSDGGVVGEPEYKGRVTSYYRGVHRGTSSVIIEPIMGDELEVFALGHTITGSVPGGMLRGQSFTHSETMDDYEGNFVARFRLANYARLIPGRIDIRQAAQYNRCAMIGYLFTPREEANNPGTSLYTLMEKTLMDGMLISTPAMSTVVLIKYDPAEIREIMTD